MMHAVAFSAGACCALVVAHRLLNSQTARSPPEHLPQRHTAIKLDAPSGLVELPVDVLESVIRHLSSRDRTVLSMTCTKLRVSVQQRRQCLVVPQLSSLPCRHVAQLPHRFPCATHLHLNDAQTGGVLDAVLDVLLPTRRWRAALPPLTMALASALLLKHILQLLRQRHGMGRMLLMLWLLGPPATGLGIGLMDLIMHGAWYLTVGALESRDGVEVSEPGKRSSWLVRWLLGSRLSAAHPLHSRASALLKRMPGLAHLELGESLVKSSLIKGAADLTQLRTLSLYTSPSICNPSLDSLTLLTRLTSFSLVCSSYDNFRMTQYLHHSDDTLRHVSHLTALESFTMSPCMGVTDEGLALLRELTRLTSLHLHVCLEISDSGLSALSPLTQLRALSLTWPLYTTPAGISFLAGRLTSITSLDFSGNQWGVTDESLETIALNMKELKVLNVYMCYGITGGMVLAGSMLSQLQALTVPWSPGGYIQVWASSPWATSLSTLRCVADSGSCLSHLHRLSGLTSLRLVLHSRVSDVATASLSRLKSLTSLSVDFNERGSISTPGWYAVLRGLLGQLSQLTVQRDSQLDYMSMRALKVPLEYMVSIDLEACDNVTAAVVAEWLGYLRRLERIGLWHCPRLSKVKVDKLQQQYSYVNIQSDLMANVRRVGGGNRHPTLEVLNQV